MNIINMTNVTQIYKIPKSNSLLKRYFKPEYTLKKAVDNITLSINQGDIIGYIGPNGAGKSTTLKILSGILTPTEGNVDVLGLEPHRNRKTLSKMIGIVNGQRSQILWDLPVIDTYDLYKHLYKIPEIIYKNKINELTNLLNMKDILYKPGRNLSLGERMKANILLALLHSPKLLLLDEPTIGLDIVTKDKMRKFLKEINEKFDVTVILTTHDLYDIDEVCNKIVIIDAGKIVYSGSKVDFKSTYSKHYEIQVTFNDENSNLPCEIFNKISSKGASKKYIIYNEKINRMEAIKYIMENFDILDIGVTQPNIDNIVMNFYKKEVDKL